MNLAVAYFESGQFCSDAQPALANDSARLSTDGGATYVNITSLFHLAYYAI